MLGAGDTAPDFQLQDMFGKQRSLRDFTAGKPVLLAFYKGSCPVCQYTFPFLERLSKSDSLEVVGISQDDLETTRQFCAAYGITFPTLLDEARRGYVVSNAFAISYVPSLFLVEPGGRISLAENGFSKRDLEAVGRIAGIEPFHSGERIPDFKAG
jgi:peroxiredoxin